MHGHRRVLPIIITVFAATVAMFSAVPAAASTQTVTLHKSDLPSGYTTYFAKKVSNAQMAKNVHFPKAQFDKHGRITGVEEEYLSSGPKGKMAIIAYVYQYSNRAGATWDYVHAVAHDHTLGKRVSAPVVGEASTGFEVKQKSGGAVIEAYLIDFHQNNYDVTVGVEAKTGIFNMSDAIRYAKIVDKRIQGN